MSRMADECEALFYEQAEEQRADQAEANRAMEWALENIVRDYITKGGAIDDVRLLCQQLGLRYEQVTGETK